MSETEADKPYYAAVEAAFIRRRGTPFLLSPKDFALMKQWRALGIPLEAVEAGIDEAFSRREERGALSRVNSLAYCHGAVLEAWERRAETAVGRGPAAASEPDVSEGLERLGRSLAELAGRRSDLEAPLSAARRSLDRLARSGRTPREVEESLARADRRLAQTLSDALPEAERRALAERAEALLGRARVRMDEQAAEKTVRALLRRLLRDHLGLPRLTLLSP